jgi:hypothetical protein
LRAAHGEIHASLLVCDGEAITNEIIPYGIHFNNMLEYPQDIRVAPPFRPHGVSQPYVFSRVMGRIVKLTLL